MAYTFIRWLRTGLAAALGDQPQSTGSARRASLSLGVNVAGSGLQQQVATAVLSVLGPGDVTGIDARQVIRTFPVSGTLDFEPTYHAHVEFDRPDLPWLFTPFGPDTNENLRPWVCLVVVKQGEDGTLTPGLPLPMLTVKGAEVARLPSLGEAHRWSHVQITGSAAAGAKAISETEPERILARLVCPRVLEERTAYLACVVPTFKIGALAALGRTVPASVPLDAWAPGDATVELPVYHHWEFSTGAGGDFQSLVLRLQAKDTLQGVGTRPLDVSSPRFGLADRPGADPVPLGGVLRVAEPAGVPVDPALAAQIATKVNATGAVGPPLYGRWHAATTNANANAKPPLGWVDALNVDPRHRVAAGLGTQVVQERQEDLMAAVWEQLGDILSANQLLRQAQVAIAASERVLARHLMPLPGAALLAVAGPAIARVRSAPHRTIRASVARSCLPVLALSGAFRKIVRAHGPIERRLRRRDGPKFPDVTPVPALAQDSLLAQLAAGSLALAPRRPPDGAVLLPSRFGAQWGTGKLPPSKPPKRPTGVGTPLDELGPSFDRLAARARSKRCDPLDVAATVATIRQALAPDVAIADRVRRRVALPPGGRVVLSSRLDPVMAAPDIPTPMIGPLLELEPAWLLPGIEAVPANTLTIVQPNAAFIEGYLVGLNHEMGRELLWRGFPTDQRGTVFSRFWDRRGAVDTAADPVPKRDIPDIHAWDPVGELGSHLEAGGTQGPVVLLVRGDLLQRYPRATVFLQRGRWIRDVAGAIVVDGDLARREPVPLSTSATWAADTRFPQFTGQAGGDIAFYGFALAKATIRGIDRRDAPATTKDSDAGWYIVFQEQATEPRFGSGLPPVPDESSDRLAARLIRPAFRLFVHASDLIAG